jgi:hypothetical protein
VACVLLAAVCLMGVSAGLLTSTVPARAASTSQTPRPRPHCRPGTPQPAVGVIPAARLPQAMIGSAGHGQSC